MRSKRGQWQFVIGWIPVLIIIVAVLLIFGGTVLFLSANLLKLAGITLAIMSVWVFAKTQNVKMLVFLILIALALIFLPFSNTWTIARALGRT